MPYSQHSEGGILDRRHHRLLIGATLLIVFIVTILFLQNPDLSSLSQLQNQTPIPIKHERKIDTLVLYSYFETENALKNTAFFLRHGLHDSAQFIFILQGPSPMLEAIIPQLHNVRVIQRENTCMDFGAFGEVLAREDTEQDKYKKFMFLNASVRGPFMPTWTGECWTNAYTRSLSDTVKMSSLSGHCLFSIYQAQSMAFAVDRESLELLQQKGTFDCVESHQDAINKEIYMANVLYKEKGWETNMLTTANHGDPLYDDAHACVQSDDTMDPWFDDKYFGFNVHPYETIFAKANRNSNLKQLEKFTEWHSRMNYSSYDYC